MTMVRLLPLALLLLLPVGGCATTPLDADPRAVFFERLRGLCGKAFEGRVVTADPADREMATRRLVMHVRECSTDVVRIPFHVGADRSRTWVISRAGDRLRLKHDHRHEDGGEDARTQYGGDSAGTGTAGRQDFPADAFSADLFRRENIPQSVDNIWSVEIVPDRTFAYQLERPNRRLRVEFDLSRPVAPPPPPWGAR